METPDLLTDDGLVVLLLCSSLGCGDEDAPYTLAEWNQLAAKIHGSELKRPAALAGRAKADLVATLGIETDEAERIKRLLDRAEKVATELESLRANGIWAMTRADPQYPSKLRETLRQQSPSVLFGSGGIGLLKRAGVAVVGSRNVDETGTLFAREIGRKCAAAKMPVVSGGARGTDRLAMESALEAGGTAFGVLADSLERTIRQEDVRQFIQEDRLVLLTPYAPTAGFSVGAAMGRNKVIYGLAESAMVVSSEFNKGGTWAGAVEALKAGWCPVFVRSGTEMPSGNRELLKRGASALDEAHLHTIEDLPDWMRANTVARYPEPELFPSTAHERRK
jgi:predicted Rossmann fold nucleotide-binding protein DprA/Smf involved in DNA uptake